MELTTFTPSSAILTVVTLSLVPFFAVMVTSFTKMVVVLSLLRNALGLQQVPPNMVVNGIALVLSLYVMHPVIQASLAKVNELEDPFRDTDTLLKTVEVAKEPLRTFLLNNSEISDREFFEETANLMVAKNYPELKADVAVNDFVVIIPAFTISELTAAFQIGFLIFLPFLVIDMVIANVLLALNMMMLSPTVVSLPFKILLLVVVEGWMKLAHGLVMSYL